MKNSTESKKSFSKHQIKLAIARTRRNGGLPLHHSAESALRLLEQHLKLKKLEEWYK
jgi:hypothetical protein